VFNQLGAPPTTALRPWRSQLLDDEDPLGVVVADQVAALGQADLARQLQLDESGSGYRRLGRDERVRVTRLILCR
jgi:hypothetical protein